MPIAYDVAVHLTRAIGARPTASPGERRALTEVADAFRRDGLGVFSIPIRVPGRGRSRDVVGEVSGRHRCLKIVTAHADSGTAGPGASDNASGVGVLIAVAGRLRRIQPQCAVWLVATGAEERFVWGGRDHLGALVLTHLVRRRHLQPRLRYMLSVDTVGTTRRFWLRSPVRRPRTGAERELLGVARAAHVTVVWRRDDAQGNSDHREFELAHLRGMVIEVWRGDDPCGESACDDWRRLDPLALDGVERVVEGVLRRR